MSTNTTPRFERSQLVLSVDLDEWYHSRRWVDGRQALEKGDNKTLFQRLYNRDEPIGEFIEPTRWLLSLFKEHGLTVTFFVLGEAAQYYPDLIAEIADQGHEVACHGLHHVDMSVLGPTEFERDLETAAARLEQVTGVRPVGFRAPNLVYEPWATALLERHGFLYDSSVCPSWSIGGKYRGWRNAPRQPYRLSYHNPAKRGGATLVELPLASLPILKLAAGSSIITRILGHNWTAAALNAGLRSGYSGYYVHPWEFGSKPTPPGHWLRNRVFLRRVGDWMKRSLTELVKDHRNSVVTGAECARRWTISAGTQANPLSFPIDTR